MSCSTNTPISMIIKRKQWYLLSLICVFFVLPIPKAEAGFCWSLDNSGNCTLESSNGNDFSDDHDFGIRDPNTKLTMLSRPFRFRSDCHTSLSECGGQNWKLVFREFEHSVDGESTPADYQLDASLEPYGWVRVDWQKRRQAIKGSSYSLGTGGVSGTMHLHLTLTQDKLKILPPGKHRFTFVIRGVENQGRKVFRQLHYTFVFTIPEQINISGLDSINLETFPKHKVFGESEFCVSRSRWGKFSITASTNSTPSDSDSFHLKNSNAPNSSIKYGVKLGAPEDSFNDMLPVSNMTRYYKDNFSQDLITGPPKDCSNHKNNSNMKIRVDLQSTFTELSTLPAGSYTDTITLTVAPE